MARTVEPTEHTMAVPVRGVHVKLTQVLGFVSSVLDWLKSKFLTVKQQQLCENHCLTCLKICRTVVLNLLL